MRAGITTVVHVFGAMDRGGAEMRTLELIRLVDSHRIRSIFVTLSGRPGALASQFEAVGAEVVPLKLSPSFPMAFVRLLRDRDVDVVHSHVALFSGAVLALAKFAGVRKRIAHFRSDSPPDRPGAVKRVEYWIMRLLINRTATDIIGVAPGSLTHGWNVEWEKDQRCRFIPSGLDLTRFDEPSDVERLRTSVGAAPQEKVIIHVGRGVPLKNRERAIAILAEISRHRPATWLVFVGSDTIDDRSRWQSLARDLGVADRVAFLGDRDDVPELLAGADLLLQTSHYEGLPGVLVEASAAGTPSLVSDLPGSRFLATHLQDVYPVSLTSPDSEWAQRALSLLDVDLTPGARRAAFIRLRDGIFDLRCAAPQFSALWTGTDVSQDRK